MADPFLTLIGPSTIRAMSTVLVEVSQPDEVTETDPPEGVILMSRQGPVVECVYFLGAFLPPYSGFAIQAPAGGVAKLHFQIKRDGGWKETPQFQGVAWSFNV